jgi:hypothetical protein
MARTSLRCVILTILLAVTELYAAPTSSASPGPGVASYEIVDSNSTDWPYYVFKSSSITPPVFEINATGESLAPGLIFVTPSGETTEAVLYKGWAPEIWTDEGHLVWQGPTSTSTNFKTQVLNGKPVLTYWQGTSTNGVTDMRRS